MASCLLLLAALLVSTPAARAEDPWDACNRACDGARVGNMYDCDWALTACRQTNVAPQLCDSQWQTCYDRVEDQWYACTLQCGDPTPPPPNPPPITGGTQNDWYGPYPGINPLDPLAPQPGRPRLEPTCGPENVCPD